MKQSSLTFFRHRFILIVPAFVEMLVALCNMNVVAQSNNSTDFVLLPRDQMTTWAWKSSDFQGFVYREWDERLSFFTMTWNTTAGDMIQYLGRGQGSFPLWISDISSSAAISWKGTPASDVPGRYAHGLYGWAGTQPGEYLHEWYVVFEGKDPGQNYISIGNINVDGKIFDCYKQWMSWGSPQDWQYQAFARDKTWSPAVRIKPILKYFTDNGMHDCILSTQIIIEGFAGSNGSVTYDYVDIPSLTSNVINRSFEKDKGSAQTPLGWSTYSTNGIDDDADSVTDSDSYNGDCALIHTKNGPYRVSTYQNIMVPNGTYTFKVRAKTSQGGVRAISARDYGGADVYRNVTESTGSYSETSLQDIKVTNGTIGLWMTTDAATDKIWTLWDCVDLIMTSGAAPPVNKEEEITSWSGLDANTTIKVDGTQVEVSRLHPAGYNTGMQYPYIARTTLDTPLSNDGNSVTIEFKIKGWLDWARIALTFGNTTSSYLNPPFFIQNDGKTNFNWTPSATALDPAKWYKVTIVMNPTRAEWKAGDMSYSFEVWDIEKNELFTSGMKTPASNETTTVIPQSIKYINWANRTSVQPVIDSYWTVVFKDFRIHQTIPVSSSVVPKEGTILVYPNPVRDILYVKNAKAGAKVYIYDIRGSLCIEELLTNNTVDVSKLTTGIYTILIMDQEIKYRSKFIKQGKTS